MWKKVFLEGQNNNSCHKKHAVHHLLPQHWILSYLQAQLSIVVLLLDTRLLHSQHSSWLPPCTAFFLFEEVFDQEYLRAPIDNEATHSFSKVAEKICFADTKPCLCIIEGTRNGHASIASKNAVRLWTGVMNFLWRPGETKRESKIGALRWIEASCWWRCADDVDGIRDHLTKKVKAISAEN